MKICEITNNSEVTSERLVLAMGFFDGVHLGHQAVIELARNLAQKLRAHFGVYTFWPHPSEVLGFPKPLIFTREQRQEKMQKLGVNFFFEQIFTDHFGDLSVSDFFDQILKNFPNLVGIVVGEDFHFGKGGLGNVEVLKSWNKDVFVAVQPDIEWDGDKVSSTRIREAMRCGELPLVNAMLGSAFSIGGSQQVGRQFASKNGFATINLAVNDSCLLPNGVYRVKFFQKSCCFWGIANLGIRPTFFSQNGNRILELHALDCPQNDLSLLHVSKNTDCWKVEFFEFLRPEKCFDSPEHLISQIQEDIIIAKNQWLDSFKNHYGDQFSK